MSKSAHVDQLLRDLAPQVLGTLVRRHGDFHTCEDAVQEALVAAAVQWAEEMPENPKGWLITVASRRRIEFLRSASARQRREETFAATRPPDPETVEETDDTLQLLFLCCHPSLTVPSQVALTLRAVGGLTTSEIAGAFLVPEATMAQRISRAKQRIRDSGAVFQMPPDSELTQRVKAVLKVLYLVFNEGYTATEGASLNRLELSREAIRLTRVLHGLLPDDGEVAGLLALMLLADARRPARITPDGALIPLAEQDRRLWDRNGIGEGVELLSVTLTTAPIGPYQVQAAIAAVHDEAPAYDETDWPQILSLYGLLARLAPGPMVTLNRVVALAMVDGPKRGLEELRAAESDPALSGHHRVDAVKAHLLEMVGDSERARHHYRLAARRTLSIPERRYLESRASQIAPSVES